MRENLQGGPYATKEQESSGSFKYGKHPQKYSLHVKPPTPQREKHWLNQGGS